MLFQPTNITPSTRGSMGDWTADVSQGELTVSWMVNGNSPMVAFSIVFYRNDAASTLVYNTGKLTDGCPFYGVDYKGDSQFFSHTFTTALGQLGFVNGQEYKFIITQWWGDTDAESVTQSSASVFLTRSAPVLTMTNFPYRVNELSATYTAMYTQAEGDALEWVRWILASSNDLENPLADTGKIYGTSELKFTYTGFGHFGGYAVKCMIQTENGVEVETPWYQTVVDYGVDSLDNAVQAHRACGASAVKVSWDSFPMIYIPGTGSGTYEAKDGTGWLASGASIVWDEVNNEAMGFSPVWSLLFKTTLQGESATFLSLEQSSGDIVAGYDAGTSTFSISKGNTTLYSKNGIGSRSEITVILTQDTVYLRIGTPGSGLFPQTDLYPSADLYPGSISYSYATYRQGVTYTQETITSVEAYGYLAWDYIEILEGDPDSSIISQAWTNGTYNAGFKEGVSFSAQFGSGIGAGVINDFNGENSIVVFRGETGSDALTYIGEVPATATYLYDYGARSQQGPYQYHVFFTNVTSFLAGAVVSNDVSPCFWDWSLLSCSLRDGAEDEYQVIQEFRFGKNLSSGQVGNNNSPFVATNFTQYPTVQSSPANWKSGTLQSLIGVIDYANGQNTYSDTLALRDAIYALSTTSNTLFLKNRKGDLLLVRVSGQITMETMDDTREQAQKVSLPWVEVGSAEGVSITVLPGDSLYA